MRTSSRVVVVVARKAVVHSRTVVRVRTVNRVVTVARLRVAARPAPVSHHNNSHNRYSLIRRRTVAPSTSSCHCRNSPRTLNTIPAAAVAVAVGRVVAVDPVPDRASSSR